MTPITNKLPSDVLTKIIAQSLDNHRQHHMPIPVYAEEMGEKADILRLHAPVYMEKMKFDVTPLADEIDLVKKAMLEQEITWIDGEKQRDAKTRFWYSNKEGLYSRNHELGARLDFFFIMQNNEHAQNVLESIGTSDDDRDAVHDGRRYSRLLKENHPAISGTLYTEEELQEFYSFYEEIEEAKEAAEADRSSPNEDRILRDKIYLYLRSLETIVRKAAKAAFFDNQDELSRYESDYVKRLNQKYRKK